MPAPVPPLSTMGIGAAIERAGPVAAATNAHVRLTRGGAALLLDPTIDVPLSKTPVAAAARRRQSTAAGSAIDPTPRHAPSLGDVVGISQTFGHALCTDEGGRAPLCAA